MSRRSNLVVLSWALVACSDQAPAPATRLGFGVQPANATAGVAITPAITVHVLDDDGNVVTSATNAITLSIAGIAFVPLNGTLVQNAVAGVATFSNLSLNAAMTFSLSASAEGLDSAKSAEFTVSPGPPAALGFGLHPTSGAGGQVLPGFAAFILDAFGNVASSNASVTLSLGTNPGQGTLSGTLTMSANNGFAPFSNVRIDRPGTGYTVTVSSPGLTPSQSNAFDITLTFASISAGGSFLASGQSSGHTCGVTTGGIGYCWGANAFGQLGDGTTTDQTRPTLVSGGHVWANISAGGHHTCGMTTGAFATVLCWGRNSNGQAGPIAAASQSTPAFVVTSASTSPQTISAGDMHTCIASGFNALCWGLNSSGQLGDGTTTDRSTPVQVTGGFNAPFARISADSSHTCGIYSASAGAAMHCWGSNDGGKLGIGLGANSSTPVLVSGGFTYLDVAVGLEHSCGLATNANIYCWGRGDNSQIGDGNTQQRLSPTQVSGGPFNALTAGWHHNCGLTSVTSAVCWGTNASNQLGDNSTSSRSTPTAVSAVSGANLLFSRVDASRSHTCGVTTTGVAFCWGSNSAGQLGDGTTTQRAIPTRVIQ